MKALKAVGIALGLLLALAAAGAAVLAITFDTDRIKAELAKAMLEKKQRTLRIDGGLALSFWPDLGVRAEGLSLSERGSDREFAALRSARISVAVKPLFSKRVVVNAVEIEGPRIALVRLENGELNIADLLPRDDEEKTPLRFEVAGLRIADAELSWKDERSGGTATLSGLDLSTGRILADTGTRSFAVETPRLSLAGGLELAHPALRARPLKARVTGDVHADLGKQTARLALDARFDDSRAELKADVLRFAPLSLRFDLAIDRLNLDRYLTAGRSSGGGKLDLEAFRGWDIRGTARIGEFRVGKVESTNVRLELHAPRH